MLEDQKSGCNLSYEYYWNNKIKLKALSFYLWVNELFKLLFFSEANCVAFTIKGNNEKCNFARSEVRKFICLFHAKLWKN